MGYIWAVLGAGNAAIVNETVTGFGGRLGHGPGNVRIAKRRWEGRED
jgi:hypothetical protein